MKAANIDKVNALLNLRATLRIFERSDDVHLMVATDVTKAFLDYTDTRLSEHFQEELTNVFSKEIAIVEEKLEELGVDL